MSRIQSIHHYFTEMHLPFEKRFPSELNRDHDYFMSHAYNQALLAWEKDEVPIGAVIVHEGAIIASAFNQTRSTNDPSAHAEMLAISQASNSLGDWRLNNCILYVTKEPCPMCAGALWLARIDRCVFGCRDPKTGFLGSISNLMDQTKLNHHYSITSGILHALRCRHLCRSRWQYGV